MNTARTVSIADLPDILPRPAPEFWDSATPVHQDDEGGWHVFSYADVTKLLVDSDTFSYDLYPRFAEPGYAGMWAADPPRHTDLRVLAAPRFSARALHNLAPTIREVVDQTLDPVVRRGDGTVDVMREVAVPVGRELVQRILGMRVDGDLLSAALTQQRNRQGSRQPEAVRHLVEHIQDRIRTLRTSRVRQGLMGDLLNAQDADHRVAGEPLTDWDLVGYVWLLLVSASDGAGLGPALLLSEAHGFLDDLRRDPDLIPGALDETLRWWPELPALRLKARRATRFGSVPIAAGSLVTGWFTAANRDPLRFPDPTRFDIRRPAQRHLGFGRGIHHCLGASFARLQTRITAQRLLERLPGLARDRSQAVELLFSFATHLESAPFRYDG
jgi:cytochrome P450